MIWTNKGHQFDKAGERLKDIQKIYIYGAGQNGRTVLEAVSFLNVQVYFVDSDKKKQGRKIDNCLILTPEKYELECQDSCITVFAVSRNDYFFLNKKLLGNGMQENVDFFYYDIFLKLYINLIAVYRFDKVCIEQVTQMVTTCCSLKCRDCMMSIPYLRKWEHINLEKLKKDTDLLFKKVDYVKYFGPGETVRKLEMRHYPDNHEVKPS